MRPRGTIRQSLAAAFASAGPCSWLEAAQGTPALRTARLNAVRKTAENMVLAGELRQVGTHRPPGRKHWFAIYELADEAGDGHVGADACNTRNAAFAELERAMVTWRRR